MKTLVDKLFVLIAMLCCPLAISAQYSLSGTVKNDKALVMSETVVSLQQADSLVGMTLVDSKGRYKFVDLQRGEYTLSLSCPDYQPVEETFELTGDKRLIYVIYPMKHIELEEVSVVADKSQLITHTANSDVFYLSAEAKKKQNPYEALREIPKLVVNESDRSIKIVDGTSPLILINGHKVNAGINSIDPKDVEAVEIISNPSARYLKDGVQCVVNIKMKQKTAAYQTYNMNTRHMLPVLFGYTGAYYELGNSKASVSLNASHFYFHHDDSEWNSLQKNTGYEKTAIGKTRQEMSNPYVALNADWICSPKDYFAMSVTYYYWYNKNKEESNGVLKQNGTEDIYESVAHDKTDSDVGSLNLYHKHTFSEKKSLETTLHLNMNNNTTLGARKEQYSSWDYENLYDYDNSRWSGGLELDYSFDWLGQNFDIGSNTRFLKDRIKQVSAGYPTFSHKEWSEYAYASVNGMVKTKFLYMLSLGADLIFKNAGGVEHNYCKPVAAVSGTYKFNSIHSVRLNYNLSNWAPAVGNLNPYNTSTDSLVVMVGNPYLLPARHHVFRLCYMYNNQGLYIEPSVRYQLSTDRVEVVGSTKDDVYTQTYANMGIFHLLNFAVNANYHNQKWGGVGLGMGYEDIYYMHRKGKGTFHFNFNSYGWYKRLSWNIYGSCRPYSYSMNSKSKSFGAESELMLTWRLNNHFGLVGSLRYLLGTIGTDTTTSEGTYYSFVSNRMTDRSFRFAIGFNYYMQGKNFKYRNKKTLQSTESGIKL
jgi:iron complex outermembrane receptor protein